MQHRVHAILTSLLGLLFLLVFASSILAQQNGVQRSVTLAELTYGETVTAVVPAADGKFWVGGYTCSATLPTTSDAVQRTSSTSPCIPVGFFERMKSDGSIDYLSYWGGSGRTEITALASDASGSLYIAGWTDSSDFQTTAGAYDRKCDLTGTCGETDGFITKLAPDGSAVVYSTYLGGSQSDAISAIAVDSSGRAHVAGNTDSMDFPATPGALQTMLAGPSSDPSRDGFYARLSADGSSLEYSTYLGGSSDDSAKGVAVDAAGNGYVVGTTASTDFPLLNAAQSEPGTAFLAKFNGSAPIYSTYMGGSGPVSADAAALFGSMLYVAGWEDSADVPRALDAASGVNAYIAELDAATGAMTRGIAIRGASGTVQRGLALAMDKNQVAYMVGSFDGNDCSSCGPESSRYPTTWDAYKRQLSGADIDAVLSIVDFGSPIPTVRYSTMLGGSETDSALAVALDGAGGAFVGGTSQAMDSVNGQAPPPMDPAAVTQSFVAHVAAHPVEMPTPPSDIVLYSYDLSGISPTAIAGNWKLETDSTAAGGWIVHQPDHGVAKVTTPAANPANYFELEFLAQAGVPYHLWMRMRADSDSYQNDSVWVQFSDSVDGSGNPIWRTHSTDGTAVSLEDCSGCGEQGWGWNDNGYGTAGTPVIFATSGWHTIRIQQREDGIAIDQIVLSSDKWADTAPGANKNDATVLTQSFALPSVSGNAPPAVSITKPLSGTSYTVGASVTITADASDSDGSVSKVDFYENGSLLGTSTTAPYSITWNNIPAGRYTLTAIATDNQGATTTSAPVGITVSMEVGFAGFRDADVGATGAKGFAEEAPSAGPVTVHGAGADVWGTSDALNYLYAPLSGDGDISTEIVSVSDEANWVKAGLMIRGSLDPSAAQAFILVSHAKGVAFQRRTADRSTTISTPGAAVTAPYWVRLHRTGNTIYAYESADGSSWTLVGSDSFTMPATAYVGFAVSSHVYGTLASATFEHVSTAGGVGIGDADIGAAPVAGSGSYDNGTWTLTGSGADIWGTADAFHFTYGFLDGDGTMTARVATVENVSPWVKAGVMIRETLDPSSPHAFMLVSASKGVAFQRRDAAGDTSVSTAGSASTAPHWVKVVRSGNTFTGYESSDGMTWTLVGSDTIPMGASAYIGLAVTSHNTSASATCTFDTVQFRIPE